jgi:uncharacterized membrane protein YphA (DoxX/SURF4 family)
MIRRFLACVVLTGVGLFCYFVCQGMFSGYPKYHSQLLSIVGMVLVVLIGGVAWAVDEHRMRDDD